MARDRRYYEMSVEQIAETVAGFADAAERAKRAGFDGIELHAGHGYLLANFLSPYTNKRNDQYGGSAENRARFLVETIRAVRATAGENFPILVRLDGKEYRIDGGITPEDCVQTARLCEEAGADAIDVSAYGSVAHAIAFTEAPLVHEPGGFVPFAIAVKKAVGIPVIGVGRIEPELAERHIAAGDFDFLALGRPLLADPDLPNKLAAGQDSVGSPLYLLLHLRQPDFHQQTGMLCCQSQHRTRVRGGHHRPQRRRQEVSWSSAGDQVAWRSHACWR